LSEAIHKKELDNRSLHPPGVNYPAGAVMLSLGLRRP
jgi:hypothetical protein